MDARMALRVLVRQPGVALAVTITLGLGIGGATATYAVFNHVAFRPVPGVAGQNRLITVYYQSSPSEPNRTGASLQHLDAMREGSPALQGLAAWQRREVGFGLESGVAPEVMPVTLVTADYFDVLGIRARVGRLLADDDHDGQPVLVVSERFADARLGGGDVVGRRVFLNGRSFLIVGVADAFRGVERIGRDDAWAPFEVRLTAEAPPAQGVFNLVGRLRPGASVAQAQEQLRGASVTVGEVRVQAMVFEPIAFPGLTDGIGLTQARLVRIYTILMVGALMLLALGCANAANLLVARNVQRRHELALRVALGAGRTRLIREQTIEAALLSIGAALVGLTFASLLTGLFRGARILSYLPAIDSPTIDLRVIAFCIVVSTCTLLIVTVLPAHAAARTRGRLCLGAGNFETPGRGRIRSALVAVQFALSLTMLVSAGLLANTAWRLQSLDLGFAPDGILTFRVRPYQLYRDDVRSAEVLRQIDERLRRVPELTGVASAWASPLGSTQRTEVEPPRGAAAEPVTVISHSVSATYFEVLRIPLLGGRSFTPEEERETDEPVRPIVVSESFARRWFGTEPPVGREVRTIDRRGDITLRVVGLAGDAHHRELREGVVPMIYFPAGRLRTATLMIRTSLPTAQAIAAARSAVYEVDPVLPVSEVGTLTDVIHGELAEERLLARTGLVMAGLAVVLAVMGLHAVMSFFVSQRVRDIAVRRALGASRVQIGAEVFRHVAAVLAVGFACGLALVLATSRLLSARLHGVEPLDPLTIAGAAVILIGAAMLAAAASVRRAVRVDPMLALRFG